MSADLQKAKEATIRCFDNINSGDMSEMEKWIDEWYAQDAVIHYPPAPNLAPGAAGVKQFMHQLFRDHTGIHITLDDMFGEGDRLACRYTWQGTNKSTGKRGTLPLLSISRYAGGKIVEEWEVAGPAKEE
jgi:predicted SnoaL-like aldol condensation-catalyzing enzyme